MANAVFHKSYELKSPIEVQIWRDKIEILSFLGPVPSVDARVLAENKRIVARDYRNRRVGYFLKELHLTEGRGTGIPTIRRTMERNGSPEPIFETDSQSTYFLTTLLANPEVDQQESNQGSKILHYYTVPRSRKEILSKLGLTNQTKNYRRYVEPLLKKELLRMTNPENPRDRNQKYLSTTKRKALLVDGEK